MIPKRNIIKLADKRYMVTEGAQVWYFEVIHQVDPVLGEEKERSDNHNQESDGHGDL